MGEAGIRNMVGELTGKLKVSDVTCAFRGFMEGFIGFYRVLYGFIWFYMVLYGFMEWYRVLTIRADRA